jgi:hypothetical protein
VTDLGPRPLAASEGLCFIRNLSSTTGIPMLRRALVIWLLLSHVAYGFSAVADGHWERPAGNGGASPHTHGAGEPQDETGCDHCCHASSHLTALVFMPEPSVPGGGDGARGLASPALESFPIPPPRRPPKA